MNAQKRHARRVEFLRAFEYPAWQESAEGRRDFGRIAQIKEDGNELEIDLKLGFLVKKFRVPLASELVSMSESNAYLARDVLSRGDLILLDHEASPLRRVELLVPSLANEFTRSPFEHAESWSNFLNVVRDFFKVLNFIEVRTPTLVPSPGLEPHLDPFQTTFSLGSRVDEFYLPTSPEFHLKKMLAMGFQNVFEFKECFRNCELGPHHQPEFLMLEWYRGYSNLNAIKKDVEDLLSLLVSHFQVKSDPPQTRTVAELFREKLEFELRPDTTRGELAELAHSIGIKSDESDSWDDLYFRIFLEKIEGGLGSKGPIFVTNYPPSQAALARITKEGWADRFELYWKGLELANAFHELNDPTEQISRFKKDIEAKTQLGKPEVPVDHEFLEALKFGVPPSGGIALGLERLFMALMGISTLSKARAFPILEDT